MKRPIKPSEIRKGDLIRKELDHHPANYRAIEFVANSDGSEVDDGSVYYLLDRLEPAVELPTEPTLGWATGDRHRSVIGYWDVGPEREYLNRTIYTYPSDANIHIEAKRVTAFTPATAVPTEALDLLRLYVKGLDDLPILRAAERATAEFIRAVDEANGGAS